MTISALLATQRGDHRSALSHVGELARLSRRQPTCRAQELADVGRICVAGGRPDLVRDLLDGCGTPVAERHRCAVAAARATLAETDGELATAAAGYDRVGRRWERYGHRLEHGHALLGAGRCRVALGSPGDAEPVLRRAAAIFEELEIPGATAEAQQLLAA